MKTEPLVREFAFDGRVLPDPNPSLPPSSIREIYAAQFPELATANIEGPEMTRGKQIYRFARAIGAKG